MRNLLVILTLAAVAVTGASASAETTIRGNYIESRSCDVYTGFCIVNAELGLTGHEAILTWDVTQGSWNDIDLTGKKVIAIVRASATLGDRDHDPLPARAILVLDNTATDVQQEALASLAKELGGKLVENVVKMEHASIRVDMDTCGEESCATVEAGDFVNIDARCLHTGDKLCGNEEVYFKPLTDVQNAMVHYTERDRFAGEGLGIKWDWSGRRGTFLANFAR